MIFSFSFLSFRHCEGVLPAHAVEGLREDLRCHAVLVLQDQALLQSHRHGRAVFGAFAAGETHAVQPAADLRQRGREGLSSHIEHIVWGFQFFNTFWVIFDVLKSRISTSAACHRMSTFLFFLAWTFCPRNLSSSGRHVWERDLGRPEGGLEMENEKCGTKKKRKLNKVSVQIAVSSDRKWYSDPLLKNHNVKVLHYK